MIFNTMCSKTELSHLDRQLARLLAHPDMDPNDTAKIKRLRKKIEVVTCDLDPPPEQDEN